MLSNVQHLVCCIRDVFIVFDKSIYFTVDISQKKNNNNN